MAHLRLRATAVVRRGPGVLVACEAARAWAIGAVEPTEVLPLAAMSKRWEASERLFYEERPWAAATSPADAMRLSMARAGVEMTASFALRMAIGGDWQGVGREVARPTAHRRDGGEVGAPGR